MEDLKIIKKYLNRIEAEIDKGILSANDIESMISADDVGGVRAHLAIGNVKLLVRKEDFDKASEILKKLPEETTEDDIEETEYTPETELIYAVKANALEPTQILLEDGADPNAKDNEGKTALEYAKEHGNQEMINLIEKHMKNKNL